jgi:hypothetical protein
MRLRLAILLFHLVLASACKKGEETTLQDEDGSSIVINKKDSGLPDNSTPTTTTTEESDTEEIDKIGYGKVVDVDSLAIESSSSDVTVGISLPLRGVATYADMSKALVTTKGEWSVDNTSLASIVKSGNTVSVKGIQSGSVDVRFTYEGKSVTKAYTVSTAEVDRIDITPKVLLAGTTTQIIATAIFTDNTTEDVTQDVALSIADGSVAKISTSDLTKVEALSPGTFTLNIALNGKSYSAPLEVRLKKLVSIEVSAATLSIVKGTSTQFSAEGTFEDNTVMDITSLVTWSSSDESLLAVSNEASNSGRATGVDPGSVTVTASLSGIDGTLDAMVILSNFVSIHIDPATSTFPLGLTKSFKVIGTNPDASTQDITDYVIWQNSDPTKATMGDPGTFTAMDMGQTTLTVQYGSLSDALLLDIVGPAISAIEIIAPESDFVCGVDQPVFTVKATYSDGGEADISDSVAWGSLDPTIGDVSNAAGTIGQLTTFKPEAVTLVAEYFETVTGETLQDQVDVTVAAPILSSVEIATSTPSVAMGRGTNLKLNGHFSCGDPVDYTELASWVSADDTILEVSDTAGTKGKVTTSGSTAVTLNIEVTATYSTFTDTFDVEVRPQEVASILLSPLNTEDSQIDVGATGQQIAKALMTNGTYEFITDEADWTMTDAPSSALASVDDDTQKGLVTGISEGTASITATLTTPYGQFSEEITVDVRSVCPAGGTRSGYYCWYLGTKGDTCDNTCSNVSATYHEGTAQAGDLDTSTAQTCNTALMALGYNGGMAGFNLTHSGNLGIGCSVYSNHGVASKTHYRSPITNSSDFDPDYRRVCACRH